VGTLASTAFCQSSDQTIPNLVKQYDAQDAQGRMGTFLSPQTWLDAAALQGVPASGTAASTSAVKASVAPSVAQSRTDQQTTASAGTSGTTSAVSKGSVPSLLSFAEEYGGLTQSVSGSVTTVQGNVANIIKAISAKEYEKSFTAGANNPFVRSVSKASFSIGLNTGTTGSSTSTSAQPSTFSSATAHIDLINYRDPRDKHWEQTWRDLAQKQGQDIEDEVNKEVVTLKKSEAYNEWRNKTQQTLTDLATYEKTTNDAPADRDKKISAALQGILDDFKTIDGISEVLLKAKLAAYTKQKQSITDIINKSPVFSFEYTFTNQSSVQLPKSTTQTYAIGTTAPNLSNFNFIFGGPLSKNGAVQITANASTTLFTSASSQLHLTPVRDYKFAAEVDIPVPAIASLAKSTVSLSGLFQGLLQEPLGQQVMVNGVAVKNTGNIVLGQAKWSFPVGTSGITFPISITVSNRTELIKEKDVKGTIGVSYNLDSLFSKQQP
jgi:hypothetical protein